MPQFSQGYAVLAGVGADLPATVRDAVALATLLRDPARCAFPADQVHLLTEAGATRAGILTALERLAQSAPADAAVIVYFSGHGYCFQPIGQPETLYLLPYGYDLDDLSHTCMSGDEFTARLRAIQVKKLLVLLDCCHAGGVAQPKAPGMTMTKSPLPLQAEAVLAEGSGRVILASSRRDELSYIGTPYSQFTEALLEALGGAGAAEQDGYTRVLDMALYVGRMVPNRTKDKQHPLLKVANLENNFALAYYAGGAKTPLPLPNVGSAQSHVTTTTVDEELIKGYRKVLRTYRRNLLEIETRMAEFVDQRMVPPDLRRARKGVLTMISELERELGTR
jgi:hypothetical protein